MTPEGPWRCDRCKRRGDYADELPGWQVPPVGQERGEAVAECLCAACAQEAGHAQAEGEPVQAVYGLRAAARYVGTCVSNFAHHVQAGHVPADRVYVSRRAREWPGWSRRTLDEFREFLVAGGELGSRQRAIAHALARGLTPERVGEELGITGRTVYRHCARPGMREELAGLVAWMATPREELCELARATLDGHPRRIDRPGRPAPD